jgi:hypothetical protein
MRTSFFTYGVGVVRLLAIAMWVAPLSVDAKKPCKLSCSGTAPGTLPPGQGSAWPQGTMANPTSVTVNVSSDFGSNTSCISTAIYNWNVASAANQAQAVGLGQRSLYLQFYIQRCRRKPRGPR